MAKHDAGALEINAAPHAFRHALASAMLENDAPLSLIQDLLGHSWRTVTRQVYAAYERESRPRRLRYGQPADP
jgi:site-specific recombinase XerD